MYALIIHTAGVVGVALIVGAYFLLQTGRMDDQSVAYSLINLIGACLVVASLIEDFNLPAFIVESFWILISAVGLYRSLRNGTSANPDGAG